MEPLLMLAAVIAPLPLDPDQTRNIRCVALLAIVASEQQRGVSWSGLPVLKDDGARFAGIVGEAVMSKSHRTREQVRDLILIEARRYQGVGASRAAPPSGLAKEADTCVAVMRARLPAPPRLSRCAAIMGLAYDTAKARDGLDDTVNDLGTLASLLADRARLESAGIGQATAETEAQIANERAAAAATVGASEDELSACAALVRKTP